MRKRSRLVWLGLSTLLVVVATSVALYLDYYNSTEAKVERMMSRIVAEHRLELVDSTTYPGGSSREYRGRPISDSSAAEIVQLMRNELGDWRYEEDSFFHDLFAWPGVEDIEQKWYSFDLGDDHNVPDWMISFSPDDKGHTAYERPPASRLSVSRPERVSLWQQLREKLPW